jgi:hypothetical protein
MATDFEQLFYSRTTEFVTWLFEEMAPTIKDAAQKLEAKDKPSL